MPGGVRRRASTRGRCRPCRGLVFAHILAELGPWVGSGRASRIRGRPPPRHGFPDVPHGCGPAAWSHCRGDGRAAERLLREPSLLGRHPRYRASGPFLRLAGGVIPTARYSPFHLRFHDVEARPRSAPRRRRSAGTAPAPPRRGESPAPPCDRRPTRTRSHPVRVQTSAARVDDPAATENPRVQSGHAADDEQ